MRKNHKREYRLSAAKKWIETFSGKNIVKSYSKKFSVDKLCAIKELRMVGVEISAEYERRLINSMKELSEQRRFLREKWDNESCEFESDESFAMILGYTSGGFPYGLTHEEMDEMKKSTTAQQHL